MKTLEHESDVAVAESGEFIILHIGGRGVENIYCTYGGIVKKTDDIQES